MADEEGKQYGFAEDDGGSDDAPRPHERPRTSEKPEPFEIENPDEAAPESTEGEDRPKRDSSQPVPLEDDFRCPNCNASMPGDNALVCIRCGFDLESLQLKRTDIDRDVAETKEEPEPAPESEEEVSLPLSRPGRGDRWLPMAMAALGGLLLVIGYFAGAAGLYPFLADPEPGEPAAVIPVLDRIAAAGQFFVLVIVLAACALGGLFMLSLILNRPLGDMRLAAMRMLGIVVTMRLVTFINLPIRQLEWVLEMILQGGIFIGLGILLFALQPRDGALLGGCALLGWVGLWVLAHLVLWAA